MQSRVLLNMGSVGTNAFSHRANILTSNPALLNAFPMVSITTELQEKSHPNIHRKFTRLKLIEQFVPAGFALQLQHFGDDAGH